ncbi:MAG: hypothetical protein R3B13_33390 [Polyangiaceae bacterium]
MMNLEAMNVVHAVVVGVCFATLEQDATVKKRWLSGALIGAAALFGYGDQALLYGVAFAIAGAVPGPPSSPRLNRMMLAAVTAPFVLALQREPLPWDDPRVWVWPVVALLTALGLRDARRGKAASEADAVAAE